MTDLLRVDAASARFAAFFQELEGAFFEREEVLQQIALSLLSREHVLLTGPPGTAKSQLANAVFGRVICEESGHPSLYARQITESTVQTDLVGPIDFKNLMDTGRTTHFTDEGMLGAVHAFLDEVFDGRDMLLRSALNLLHERELKQGNTIERGRIECALMTTNRYISDLLERSRDNLLAFIDRIAFISFVPRGFADEGNLQHVLDRHVHRHERARLDALLTIQDLDALQALTDGVEVGAAMCTMLADLITAFDEELNRAVRADPAFVPTRYLSTRTAVRAGKILRALVVYDRIFRRPDRELQAKWEDLAGLQLNLVLSGPVAASLDGLIGRETQPQERRQLEVIRTERELFERALGRVKKRKVKSLKKEKRADESKVKPKATKKSKQKPDPLAGPREDIASDDPDRLVGAVDALAPQKWPDAPLAARAAQLRQRAIARLDAQAFRTALRLGRPPVDDSLMSSLGALASLAERVGDDRVSMHGVAQFLHEEGRRGLREAARLGGARSVALAAAAGLSGTEPAEATLARLTALEELAAMRARLVQSAALADDDREAWRQALESAEEDLAALWDASFCRSLEAMLEAQPDAPLSDVLAAIAPELQRLDEASARLAAIAPEGSRLKARAIGRRLGDLVGTLMERAEVSDRLSLLEEVDRVRGILAEAGVEQTISAENWLRWSAAALVRATEDPPAVSPHFDYEGYCSLRDAEQRTPIAYTLAEITLRVAPQVAEGHMSAVAEQLGVLPDELRLAAGSHDLSRVDRALAYLEGWWNQLSAGDMAVSLRLEQVVKSRFFEVVWDDEALVRFSLETRLIEDLFPEQHRAAEALRRRLNDLDLITRRGAQALLRGRTDEAWRAALLRQGPATDSGA